MIKHIKIPKEVAECLRIAKMYNYPVSVRLDGTVIIDLKALKARVEDYVEQLKIHLESPRND